MAEKRMVDTQLIAPCGMNCRICYAYLREKDRCTGCLGTDEGKGVSILRCRIRTCEERNQRDLRFCYKCSTFPCRRLKDLDKRYRTKYRMSMLENLSNLRENGVRQFVKSERERWKCPGCGAMICVHNRRCYECGETVP